MLFAGCLPIFSDCSKKWVACLDKKIVVCCGIKTCNPIGSHLLILSLLGVLLLLRDPILFQPAFFVIADLERNFAACRQVYVLPRRGGRKEFDRGREVAEESVRRWRRRCCLQFGCLVSGTLLSWTDVSVI